MTDVLGVCTAWGDGRCVVAPEHGRTGRDRPRRHRVGQARPAPPVGAAPGVRGRGGVRTWPPCGRTWRPCRSAPGRCGPTRRRWADCAGARTPAWRWVTPGLPFAEAEQRIRAFYAERDRPVMAQVELGSDVEDAFRAAGWEPLGSGDAHFLLASLARALRSCDAVGRAHDTGAPTASPHRVGPGAGGGRAGRGRDGRGPRRRRRTGGTGSASTASRSTRAHRRRGLGTAALAALLDWGGERGATTAWLHVETDNEAGQALYERLGFRTHHTGRYLRPVTGGLRLSAGPPVRADGRARTAARCAPSPGATAAAGGPARSSPPAPCRAG